MLPEAHAVIPARYASTRFPGKPLVMLKGKPMFWHVWQRARQCSEFTSVTLATDDERIAAAARNLDVPFVMTSPAHASGTDRVHEAAVILGFSAASVVVNVQGDEPAVDPRALLELLSLFADASVSVGTLAHVLDESDFERPDKVKVVLAANGDALYFSRAGIPYSRDGFRALPVYGHIGLYAYTMAALERFVALPPSALEQTEKLEQLRLLEHSIPVRVAVTGRASPGIDHEEDIARVLPLL